MYFFFNFISAKEYIIKLSKLWMSLLQFTFIDNNNDLLNIDEYVPAPYGSIETLKVQCPWSSYNATYYVALLTKDAYGNEAEVSNIVQVHFKEAQIPLDDKTTSGDYSNDSSTTVSFISTESNNSTTTEITSSAVTVTDKNSTDASKTENPEGIFIEKNNAIIIFSTCGVVVILIIVINIIVCICCFKMKKKDEGENPKKLSRKASLRPPYNLNIAYSRGSLSSLDRENETYNSTTMLGNHDRYYSNSPNNSMQGEQRYSYHTNKSLSKASGQGVRNELGFNVVRPMIAYATSSLSRFASKRNEQEDEPSNAASLAQTGKINNSCDAEIYPLGSV